MNKEFMSALDAIGEEKNIDKDELITAIESSIVSAYKKNYHTGSDVEAHLDRDTGEITVFETRKVVDEVEDSKREISLEEAQETEPKIKIGDTHKTAIKTKEFGRIAAQNAKQLILQRIKEAEKRMIYDHYADSVGEMATAVIDKEDRGDILVTLGRARAVLPESERVKNETYEPGDHYKVYISSFKKTNRGSTIKVSRSHPGLIKRLFESEIPEIYDGATCFVSESSQRI